MFYQYKVTYWCDYEEKEKVSKGLVIGANYSEAADNLKKDYGEDLIDMYLQELDLGYTVTMEDWNEIFH